jgi:NAD(P)-dependent dehydrogenase (short-subunit alcohol dehydrogenase family)
MPFTHKVVAITGGGTGMGRAVAQAFLERGARIVINGRRADVLEAAAHELDPSGERLAMVVGDIGVVGTATRLVQTAVERFGGLDVLINNAGVFKPIPFLDTTEADLDYNLGAILKGCFFAAQAAIPALQQRGGGAIVNTGSMWALQAIGATPSAAYSAAKAGVHALTHNLAIEFAKDHIRVNAIAPAVVETPVFNTFLSDEQVAQVLPTFHNLHPLGRNGQTRDIVAAMLFFASDEANWITGTILPVDGGVMAGRP